MREELEKKVVFPPPGKYVVAVSGGVDSVTLLGLLAKRGDYQLVLAHFDHAMRIDSKKDCEFVAELAKSYGLKFFSQRANPGSIKNEDQARQQRYKFLEKVMKKERARAIITAHHADDRIETMLFNVGRGTYKLGLLPFTQSQVVRPSKNVFKDELYKYASKNKLGFREDPTNQDPTITRNFIRLYLLPSLEQFRPKIKSELLKAVNANEKSYLAEQAQLEAVLAEFARVLPKTVSLERSRVINLESANLYELIALILKYFKVYEFNTKQLERIRHFMLTGRKGKKLKIAKQLQLNSESRHLHFTVV